MEAFDGDKSGSRNSHISYEIINGNYDKKFSIDKDTGTDDKNVSSIVHFCSTQNQPLMQQILIQNQFDIVLLPTDQF